MSRRDQVGGNDAEELARLTRAAIEAGREPVAWRFSADALWRAARAIRRVHLQDVRAERAGGSTKTTHDARLFAVIFRRRHNAPPPSVAPAYMMLAGLTLEAFAKGVLVARDPSRVGVSPREGRVAIAWGVPEHLTPQLVREAGVALTEGEIAVSSDSRCTFAGRAVTLSQKWLSNSGPASGRTSVARIGRRATSTLLISSRAGFAPNATAQFETGSIGGSRDSTSSSMSRLDRTPFGDRVLASSRERQPPGTVVVGIGGCSLPVVQTDRGLFRVFRAPAEVP